jgi:hypothetical protein
MWVRVAAFEGGDEDRLREMTSDRIASGESALPAGASRVAVLADRHGNRRLFLAWFDSHEAIEAAEAEFDRMGDSIPEEIRGRRTSVTHCEVVFDSAS